MQPAASAVKSAAGRIPGSSLARPGGIVDKAAASSVVPAAVATKWMWMDGLTLVLAEVIGTAKIHFRAPVSDRIVHI